MDCAPAHCAKIKENFTCRIILLLVKFWGIKVQGTGLVSKVEGNRLLVSVRFGRVPLGYAAPKASSPR